jgi:hypothetical protein
MSDTPGAHPAAETSDGASDADLAEQRTPATSEEPADMPPTVEADPADVSEQARPVGPDEDYPHDTPDDSPG